MRIKVGARCNVPLHRICEYILTNLFRWHLEKENTYREGDDEFDRWFRGQFKYE